MTLRTKTTRTAASLTTLAVITIAIGIFLRGDSGVDVPGAVVRRGAFVATLAESGVLKAAESVTYRSPLEGREVEITYLAPEGEQVAEGDLLVQLDTTALRAELTSAEQAVRQVELELQASEVDREEAMLGVEAVTDGASSLAVEEARVNLRLAEARASRLHDEHGSLAPLLARGFITRDEYARSALELDEANARAALAQRAFQVASERTHPAEQQAAQLVLARRLAQIEHLRPKLTAAHLYVDALSTLIARASIRAPRPGLVVYEENFSTVPRRKIRVGDRVTPAQGMVTLPDLRRMLVHASVREADVHLVKAGQAAKVRVDAFPDVQLPGTVVRLGALAQSTDGGGPRFDLVVAISQATGALRPGMNARVEVVVAERTDAVTVPITAVFTDDAVPVCYVVRRASIERRRVELGTSNDTEVEIVGGLQPGERVAVVDPVTRQGGR